ncbi:hypothetical protein [Myxosarcina sp. GI1]|uniref:hypothetical protein n=1 Tax=Myxosarcina sp. GI1 TaxID=1541065 RepID=UPI00055C1C25|nr:hypothetical protein [Myxosarcina sp. GI1]
MIFSDVVEAIKQLSTEEKQEIQLLIARYLCEERREEIYRNFQLARKEQQDKLQFSSDINELKRILKDE